MSDFFTTSMNLHKGITMSNTENGTADKRVFSTGSTRDSIEGKLRYDLIPPSALERLAAVYTRGAEQYGDRNWEKGQPISTVYGSLMRHLQNWMQQKSPSKPGDDDIAQVIWNAIALLFIEERIKAGKIPSALDDRVYPSSPGVTLRGGSAFTYLQEAFRQSGAPATAVNVKIRDAAPGTPLPPKDYSLAYKFPGGKTGEHYRIVSAGICVTTDAGTPKEYARIIPTANFDAFKDKVDREQLVPYFDLSLRYTDKFGGSKVGYFCRIGDRVNLYDNTGRWIRDAALTLTEYSKAIQSGMLIPVKGHPFRKTIYLAGPMRGYKDYNFPKFDEVKARFERLNWNVISPADLDRKAGFPADAESPEAIKQYAARDTAAIIEECDAIALLPNWVDSKGAAAELFLARMLKLEVYDGHGTRFVGDGEKAMQIFVHTHEGM